MGARPAVARGLGGDLAGHRAAHRRACCETGEATWDDKLLLFLERSGYPEETYHTFSYSPVTDDSGAVSGNLCVVTEETERVLGERRMALLRDTAVAIAPAITEAELLRRHRGRAGRIEGPAVHAHLRASTTTARARAWPCRTGIAADHPAALTRSTVRRSARAVAAADRGGRRRRSSSWPAGSRICRRGRGSGRRPRRSSLPIAQQGQKRSAGMFVAGLNPFRPLDDAYRSFVDLLVGQIAAGLANVHAYEEERRRAEALAEIDRAKTTFFSNVSHEFRTPLTLMLGPLDEARSRRATRCRARSAISSTSRTATASGC